MDLWNVSMNLDFFDAQQKCQWAIWLNRVLMGVCAWIRSQAVAWQVTVIVVAVYFATESTFEYIFRFNFKSFRAFIDFVSDLCAIVADVDGGLCLRQIIKQDFRLLKILLYKYLRMVITTLCTLLTESVHIIPTQLFHDVLELATPPINAAPHFEVGATLINMPELAMVALLAFLFQKLRANFQVMAKITFLSVSTLSCCLKLIARLYFALIVRMWTIICVFALSMDEFFTYSIISQLIVISHCSWYLKSWHIFRIILSVPGPHFLTCLIQPSIQIICHFNYINIILMSFYFPFINSQSCQIIPSQSVFTPLWLFSLDVPLFVWSALTSVLATVRTQKMALRNQFQHRRCRITPEAHRRFFSFYPDQF